MKLIEFFKKQKGESPDDERIYLESEPITKKRMDLLWINPPQLSELMQLVLKHGVITIELGDSSNLREHDVTYDDVVWAKQIEPIIDKAFQASQRGEYKKSIRYYKEALTLAPGCDLYLMSIGSNYAHLGQKETALKYLERASEISPGNARIRNNLNEVKRMQ
jgi:tetratricopeptide (TPR) repeat protein